MNIKKLVLSALLVTPAFANAMNLIANGDFETAAGASWSNTATTGFANLSAYGPCCAPTGTYPSGPNAAFFGWGDQTGGTIYQDIATIAGQSYQINFSYGAIAAAQLQSLMLSALGGSSFGTTLNATSVSATGTGDLSMLMSNYGLSFVANSAFTRILFTDTSQITASVDGVLDDVSVNAVPVPATLALLVGGIAAIAATRRKLSNAKI